MELKMIKNKLYAILLHKAGNRVNTAQLAMQSAETAKANQTKSSAGDKFETGRAMMQAEEERNKIQLIKALALKNELEKINAQMSHDTVELGSLVITNQGNYFLSVGLGKVIIEDQPYFAISMVSPIGELLYGKKIGDSIHFRGREIKIIGMD